MKNLSTRNKILSIKDLKKNYQDINSEVEALDNITLDIYEKEFLTIVGPSGCGKSTILSILSSLENKSGGNIYFNKPNIKIGYMLQDDSLFPWKTILENALLGLEVTNTLNEETRKYVIELLITYGLKDFLDKYPNSLSGGMKQRVALIRTIATKPDILLLDEPMSALDYQSRLLISDDIYKMIKSEGITAIMISHDIAEAVSMSERVVVLTKRPAKVKKIYNINLKNKSTPIKNRNDEYFNKYYEVIWSDLDVMD